MVNRLRKHLSGRTTVTLVHGQIRDVLDLIAQLYHARERLRQWNAALNSAIGEQKPKFDPKDLRFYIRVTEDQLSKQQDEIERLKQRIKELEPRKWLEYATPNAP